MYLQAFCRKNDAKNAAIERFCQKNQELARFKLCLPHMRGLIFLLVREHQKQKSAVMKSFKRVLWLSAGLICVALGIVGAVLPILPTTPFMLLATFCFAKSSKRLHNWLVNHRQFGPAIKNWQEHGAISKTAKIGAFLTMAVVLILGFLLGLKPVLLIIQATVMLGAATFILTRHSPPSPQREKTGLKDPVKPVSVTK